MLTHPMIVVVPRWALAATEPVQLLADENDRPYALMVREGTVLTDDLAGLINDLYAERDQARVPALCPDCMTIKDIGRFTPRPSPESDERGDRPPAPCS